MNTSSLILMSLAMMAAAPAFAAEIRVFTGGAPKEALDVLTPQFENKTGHKVIFTYIVITEMQKRLEAGEPADMVLMPLTAIAALAKAGKLQGESRATLGRLPLTMIVRAGAPKPDISTPDAVKKALLAAKSVTHAKPGETPSGTHLGKMMEQLGVADAVPPKTIYRNALQGGPDGVAKGDAEIGIYPNSEVVHVKGVTVVGQLPAALQTDTVYGTALTSNPAQRDAAAAFVKFLSTPEHRRVWKDAGFEPPAD